jgi:hypothetical protein
MKTVYQHKVGTFFTAPSKTAHSRMTRGEGAILYFYGTGPTGSTPPEKRIAGDCK